MPLQATGIVHAQAPVLASLDMAAEHIDMVQKLKAQLHGSGSSSNLNYITKACRKPMCAQCVCALYAYTLELIVEVTFQITHTQKHSQARVIIAYQ